MTSTPERRPTSDPKRPYHVVVAVGVTTGLYAVSLLGATSIQIETDRALIEDRAPMVSAIDLLRARHDGLEASITEARDQYVEGASGYDGIANRLSRINERLVKMDRRVASIERLSASIPTTLSISTSGGGGSQASAGGGSSKGGGGSGGGSSAGGGSGGGTPIVKPPPAPPKATPPPTSGGTGSSG